MQTIMRSLRDTYVRATSMLNSLQSPLLLCIRLYWGWQFCQDGWVKLTHLDKVTEFFATLNLPAPHSTALLVALVEFLGGALFLLGFGSRLVSLVLFANMTMAYLSVPDDRINFFHIFSKPDDFYGATPYTYWFAALLILILGPGSLSLDRLMARSGSKPASNRAHPGPISQLHFSIAARRHTPLPRRLLSSASVLIEPCESHTSSPRSKWAVPSARCLRWRSGCRRAVMTYASLCSASGRRESVERSSRWCIST